MASPLHIQFRLAGEYNSSEPPVRGEPRFDADKARFGIFNQGSTILWYPQIDSANNRLNLNANQILSGKTQTDGQNDIALDFSIDNELRVVKRSNSEVIARFASSGSFFNTSVVSGVTDIPFLNLLTNGSLVEKRPILENAPLGTTSGTFMAAPNWLVWKNSQPASIGNIYISWDTTLVSGASFSAKLIAQGSPNAAGLRHFVPVETMGGSQMTFSGYYKGTAGQKAVIRVSSSSGSIATKIITATGNTKRESLTFTVPIGAETLYVDSIYTPSFEDSSAQTWWVCAPMVNAGQSAVPFEKRSKLLEKSMLDQFYVKAGYKSEANINLHYRAMTGDSVFVFLPEVNSVTTKTITSISATVTNPDSANKIYEVMSYFSTAETS